MALFRGCNISERLPHRKCGVLWNADTQLSYNHYLWMIGFNACNMVNVNQKLAKVPRIAKCGIFFYWHASSAVMTDRQSTPQGYESEKSYLIKKAVQTQTQLDCS